jgi:hypothetical protein
MLMDAASKAGSIHQHNVGFIYGRRPQARTPAANRI